jgi:hypothetical protein
MHVIPLPLKVIGVFSQKDLNPSNSILQSLSTQILADFAPPPDAQRKLQFYRSKEVFRDKNAWRVDGWWPCRLALSDRRLREEKLARWEKRVKEESNNVQSL